MHKVILAGNRTLALSNISVNQPFLVILGQDSSGSRTVTWWAGIKWVAATIPTLSTGANAFDLFAFIYDGSNYYGSIVGLNYG